MPLNRLTELGQAGACGTITPMASPKKQQEPSQIWSIILPAAVFVATILIFSGMSRNQFLNWDDDDFLVANQAFRGFSGSHLHYILTNTTTFGYLAPVTWTSYAVDHLASGVSARGVHVHNVLLHAITAALVYLLAAKLLSRAVPGARAQTWAMVAALLFALHPLRVEPVAWASARGYLLAGLFATATLLAYVQYADRQATGRRATGWLIVAIVCYLLSLFAVPIAVGLPLVLIIIDAYPLRRFSWATPKTGANPRTIWVEKIPFVTLAVIAAVLAPLAKSAQGSLTTHYSIGERLAMTAYSLSFGVIKTLMPIRLSPLYQLQPQFNPAEPIFIAAGAFVLLVTIAVIVGRKRFPAGLAAWISYLVFMLPVSGLVHYGLQITADRYTYLASVPLVFLICGLAAWWEHAHASAGRALKLVATVALVALAAGTLQYSKAWRNSRDLWERAVSLDDRSYTGLNNLAIALEEQGQYGRAYALFHRAFEVNPAYPPVHNNLGHIAAGQGRLDAAVAHYQAYLVYKPDAKDTRVMLATVLARKGDFPGAIEQAGLVEGADAPASKLNALLTGKLIGQGYDAAALAITRAGLQQTPDDPILLNNLAVLLATSYDSSLRNGSEALAAAERMMVLMQGRRPLPQFFATLAAAYAESGQFDKATDAIKKAMVLARQVGDEDRVKQYQRELQEYRNQNPHHEPAPAPSPWAALTTTTAA